MCTPFDFIPFGYRRVARPVIRRKRIYAFAAERYANDMTPHTQTFWHAIMDACVSMESTLEPIPSFKPNGVRRL